MATKPKTQQVDAGLDAEVRARVPQWMKDGLNEVAVGRLVDLPDVAREAFMEYLERRGQKSRPDGQLGLTLAKEDGKKVAA